MIWVGCFVLIFTASWYSSLVRADEAGWMEMNLASNKDTPGVYNMDFYVPENLTINCYGTGCYDLDYVQRGSITNSSGFKFNFYSCAQCVTIEECLPEFNLYCSGEYVHGCSSDSTSNNCGCRGVMLNNTEFFQSYTDELCYLTNRTLHACIPGESCNINCTDISCENQIIDGRESTNLSISCQNNYHCQNVFIHCPIGGCNINCNGGYVCNNMRILYEGQVVDNDIVSLYCINSHSCHNLRIDAESADIVNITCVAFRFAYGFPCTIVLNANYANKVFINANEGTSSYYDYWSVQYVKQLVMNGFGGKAFYKSELHAEYAESVIIYLSSTVPYYGAWDGPATYLMDWHISPNTKFMCYGTGCYDLGTISRGNETTAVGLEFYVSSCDVYDTLAESLNSFNLYCDAGSAVFSSSTGLCNSNQCGCNDVYQAATFVNNPLETRCYRPRRIRTCNASEACVVNCDYSSGNCTDVVIDGSLASNVTVNCSYDGYCQSLVVYCPDGGECDIKCEGSYTCQDMEVMYEGYLSDSGLINILCDGTRACGNMTINADSIFELSITCNSDTASGDDTCYYLELNANNAGNVIINANEQDAIAQSRFYVENATSVEISGRGRYTLYACVLQADNAEIVEINLASDDPDMATFAMDWHVPEVTIFNCYGAGCKNLNQIYRSVIGNPNDFEFNIATCGQCDSLSECLGSFELYCNNTGSVDYFTEMAPCTTNNCGCSDIIDTRNGSTFEITSVESNCYLVDGFIKCAADEACIIHCDSTAECEGSIIDGSLATNLSLNCSATDSCRDAIVLCPEGGCHINCEGANACFGQEINYDGNIMDNAGVSLLCVGSYVCHEMIINAEFAANIEIICDANVNQDYLDDYPEWAYDYYYWQSNTYMEVPFPWPCNLTLNANHAGNVLIDLNEAYASYHDVWNVENAKNVILLATGFLAVYNGEFKGDNASSVTLSFSSKGNYSAAVSSDWYLPDDTIINCYGTGCYKLNNIYGSAELQIKIDSCGQCNGINGCIDSFSLYCDNGVDYFTSDSQCGSNNNCGCSDIVDNVEYSSYPVAECYLPATKQCEAGEPCSIMCSNSTMNSTCDGVIIDGSLTTSLTVICEGSDSCVDSFIICPNGGCDVTCSGKHSCSLQIDYYGNITDNGEINIDCTGYEACEELTVNAEWINVLSIGCYGSYSERYHVCSSTINAQHASNVSIMIWGRETSYYETWNVQYAKFVELTARGRSTLYIGVLNADYAEKVVINAALDIYYSALYKSDLRVPYDTTLNCYGYGCLYTAHLFRYTTTSKYGLKLNHDYCGHACDNYNWQCIRDFTIDCNNGTDYYYAYDNTTYSDNDCGLSTMFQTATITNNLQWFDEECHSNQIATACPVDGADCNIVCIYDQSGCDGDTFDARNAATLTVSCETDYACEDSIFVCPNSGCDIKCNGYRACMGMTVYYYGDLLDNGIMNISCDGQSGIAVCYSFSVYADNIDTIQLHCKGNNTGYDYPCREFRLDALYANNVLIDIYGTLSMYRATINVHYANKVILDAQAGSSAFREGKLNADNAGLLEIYGSAGWLDFPFTSSNFSVPQNTTFNCYGYGCYNMNGIYRHHTSIEYGLKLNIETCQECTSMSDCIWNMTIHCKDGAVSLLKPDDSGDLICGNNHCGCYNMIQSATITNDVSNPRCAFIKSAATPSPNPVNAIFITTDEPPNTNPSPNTVIPTTLPTSTPTTQVVYDLGCSSDCEVTCISDCKGAYIDGSTKDSLTINCGTDSYVCIDATIICPSSGCDIMCSSQYSCQRMKIIYDGYHEDKGRIKINCEHNQACEDMNILANNVDDIEISCIADADDSQRTCWKMVLYAKYANSVKLYGENKSGFLSSTLYCNNASTVSLHAKGGDNNGGGFRWSTLYAQNAGEVNIKCVGEVYGTCSASEYYLPENNKASISCYGRGCQGFGDIYVQQSAKDVSLYINSCGECEDVDACIGNFAIHCDELYETRSSCFEDCGCDDFKGSAEFEEKTNDENCYDAKSKLSGGAIAGIVVGVLGFMAIVCGIIVCWYRKKKRKGHMLEGIAAGGSLMQSSKDEGKKAPSPGSIGNMDATTNVTLVPDASNNTRNEIGETPNGDDVEMEAINKDETVTLQ